MSLRGRIIRNYFTFNRRERRGILVLLCVLMALASAHLYMRSLPPEELKLSKEDVLQLAELQQAIEIKKEPARDTVEAEVVWENFDPNMITAIDLMDLGLTKSLAQRIENYRAKGARFKNVGDVAKIYGMDSLWLKEAEPYMVFSQETNRNQNGQFETRKWPSDTNRTAPKTHQSINLNLADSLQLLSIPKVGPFYAKEILRLRTQLGGFRNYDQLLDIYKMREEVMESIVSHSTLDTAVIVKININRCDAKSLGMHPYLTWKQAKVIVNYRTQHGPYTSIEEILKTDVIPDTVYRKIAPYLSIE